MFYKWYEHLACLYYLPKFFFFFRMCYLQKLEKVFVHYVIFIFYFCLMSRSILFYWISVWQVYEACLRLIHKILEYHCRGFYSKYIHTCLFLLGQSWCTNQFTKILIKFFLCFFIKCEFWKFKRWLSYTLCS